MDECFRLVIAPGIVGWYFLLNRMTDLPRVVKTYRDAVSALQARDIRATERALTAHIQESEDIVLPG